MRRLYQKLYLVFIVSLLSVVVSAALFSRFVPTNPSNEQTLEVAGELVSAVLPPAEAPAVAQQQAIERLSRHLRADIAMFDAQLAPVAAAGRPLPRPALTNGIGWLHAPGGALWSFRLPDGRWIVARLPISPPGPVSRLIIFLTAMAIAIAVFAYPVARGLTKRIERLQIGVETLGAGNLATRVAIEGRDEVARLAASFNRAAARIEELVGAHRLLLANASHELRTPLSRIRLGIELLDGRPDAKVKAELAQDIAELDDLIEEILLTSRLDVAAMPLIAEEVDLLALMAEECARYDGCSLDGERMTVAGDPRLLRRLVRNLLDNAERHGKPPVRTELRRNGPQAMMSVTDAGEGVPSSEREHVFLPFYRLGGDRKGAGLGLALVRQIARLHGGEASAEPHGRSGIVVRLPTC